MRAARNPKLMHRPGSPRGAAAAKKQLSAQAAIAVLDPPDWTTRAQPKGIARVPTHAVRPPEERRAYARARLSLPLRLIRVAGQRERMANALRTMNISSSGVFFRYPQPIEPGTPLEIEVCLIDRPFGQGNVKMRTEAHVVRVEQAPEYGWHCLAASFDDITFQREEPLSPRLQGRLSS